MVRIGVDTGGTFTDFVLRDGDRVVAHKVRSTPDDPSRAILQGLAELGTPIAGADVVHGSTVATNAVLERRGARVALVATAGFEDVLRIGRQTRRELYNVFVEDRQPLVDPGLVFGMRERVTAEGTVLEPLDEPALAALGARLRDGGAEAVAVCFLHSYANPTHERAVAKRLEGQGFAVSASHRVLPEYREFERWSTTAVNAYVTPLMARYLGRLEERLTGARLRVMQSNGGSISAARARQSAVRTILSGPAAGAVGAQALAAASGFPRAIAFDMGGTSTDVTLIDRAIGVTPESSVGDFPVRLPVIDIHTVGAGGGSIAYVDSGGALRVGPRSAGGDPGPVCYGRGDDLTVTDANLLLGRIEPGYFLGGRMSLDVGRARSAARVFGARMGIDEQVLAEGIVRVANANMERAIRVVSVQRGHDPREFALLAFGGAGGLHACALAAALDMRTVIVPLHAGVLSALGMLLADVTKDYSQTVLTAAAAVSPEALEQAFAPLVERARADLEGEGFDTGSMRLERSLDVRYVGQSYEITVPDGPDFRDAFDQQHARLYGYSDPRRPAEIVNVRVKAVGITGKPTLPHAPLTAGPLPEPIARRQAWFDGGALSTPIFRREDLEPGMRGEGPAVLAGAQATTVIPPDWDFAVDAVWSVVIRRKG
jgi:N-methylhydantoinase A/oxoprolinase/acetone carboxylase beta subunit